MRPARRGGFTLLELMVAVMLLAVLATMLFQVFGVSTRVMNTTMGRHESLSNARSVMEFMQHEVEGATTDSTGVGFCGYTPAESQPGEYRVLSGWKFNRVTNVAAFDAGVYANGSFQVRKPGSTDVVGVKILPGSSVVAYHCATSGMDESAPLDYRVVLISSAPDSGAPNGYLSHADPTVGSVVWNALSEKYIQGMSGLKVMTHAWVVYFLSEDHKLYRGVCTDVTKPLGTDRIELFAVNVVGFQVEYYDGTKWVGDWDSYVMEHGGGTQQGGKAPVPVAVRLTLRVTDSRHIAAYNGVDDDGKNGIDDPDEVNDPVVDTYQQIVYVQVRRP